MKKIVISWVVCVLALVGLFAWLGNSVLPNNRAATPENPLLKADFELMTANQKLVRDEDLRGRYLLVYFGFTHCPDICPTTLLLINNVLGQLGDKAKNITPVFISVDPERDTPDIAANYAKNFGKNVLGLSGTPEQVKHAADSFKVFYSKVEDKDSALGYVVDHSGFVYLMGPKGEYMAHFAHNVSEQELKQGLMDHVR
jgi:cytochrome oxidase Cu insertion factor (SCO1/SenC/PrrC family)